jgi:hypothetical protein
VQIGFQVGTGGSGTGWSTITVDVQGWTYFNSVPKVLNTPSATPTPSSGGYVFNTGSVQGWNVNIYSGQLTTGSTAYNANASNCYAGGLGALEVVPPFTAANQQYNVDVAPTTSNFAGMGITLVADIASAFDSNAPQYFGQIYVQDGGAQGYAGSYSGYLSFGSASGSNSGCVTMTYFVPPSVSGSFDPTKVTQVGFIVGTGSGTVPSGAVTVDVSSWTYGYVSQPPTVQPTSLPLACNQAQSLMAGSPYGLALDAGGNL